MFSVALVDDEYANIRFCDVPLCLSISQRTCILNPRPPKGEGVVATPCDFFVITFFGNQRLPNGFM